jgi:hypothetical protein
MPSGQLQFNDIWASSDKNVWVATGRFVASTNSDQALLLHYNGSTWSTLTLPGPAGNGNIAQAEAVASDGSGGVWLIEDTTTNPSSRSPSFAEYLVHRTATGTLTRTKVASGSPSGVSGPALLGLTHIPGTTSLWSAGSAMSTPPATGANAVIWAFGKI